MAVVRSLSIWVFWLLASMAVGGIIGVLLSGIEGIGVGIIAGGFTYSCFSLWRNGKASRKID
jgi:hypothetical protein